MSCIAGLFHLGGEPVDRSQLDAMLAVMKLRAPDGERVHCAGAVGLGQAFLRTGSSQAESFNRLTLDGNVYIAADARIDGRAELLGQLRGAGRQVDADAPHAELILHAYAAFGDSFLNHLLGDFAFALWDARRRKLICARHPFGIRQLYWSQRGEMVVFASDIDALRTHPAVSAHTDRAAVADFLLFGTIMDAERTIYQDIRRVPRATCRELDTSGLRDRKYWQLPRRETRYRSHTDYLEHFSELFDNAVSDRLPAAPVAVPLSGGMDSTSIATVAAPHLAKSGFCLTAYHTSTRKLEPEDEEQPLAQLVADRLGIPMVAQDLSDHPLLAENRSPALRTPSPFSSGHLAVHRDLIARIRNSGARVLLSGYAGDAVFTPSGVYCRRLFKSGRWFKLLREIGHQLIHTGRLTGLGLSRMWAPPPYLPPPWRPAMPNWIAPALSEECDLPARWENWWAQFQHAEDAHDQLSLSWMDRGFEVAEILPSPLVVRYPFLDLRLVEYLLSVPNHMLKGKKLLREAMAARLPEVITRRPKTGLPGDPVRKMFQSVNIDRRLVTCAIDECAAIDRAALEAALHLYRGGAGSDSTWTSSLVLLPFAFEDWLAKSGARYE